MWIKANYTDLLTLSEDMYVRPKGSSTKYLFSVIEMDEFGYAVWTQEIEDNITFDFEIVENLPEEII